MIGTKLLLLSEVDSTNNYAAKLLSEGNLTPGTVILAEKQTAGRGQRGNSWSSVSGGQFTGSYYIDTTSLNSRQYVALNMVVALSVRAAIAHYTDCAVKVKWPNDILVADKKIAGILIESQWRDNSMTGAIAGIGVNLHGEPELASSAALDSFASELPTPLELLAVLSEKLNNFFTQLLTEGDTTIRQLFHDHLWRRGEEQVVERANGLPLSGKIAGVNADGNLVFETEQGIYTFGIRDVKFSY